jgi:hypothetical protein
MRRRDGPTHGPRATVYVMEPRPPGIERYGPHGVGFNPVAALLHG